MPVAENLLNRDFTAEHPGEKMVSDITYIPTDEGWLYLSGVMDLCGRKMVGIAMKPYYETARHGCHPGRNKAYQKRRVRKSAA